MIYLVNCDKLKFFKTFKSLDEVINYFEEKNKSEFDGSSFLLFGRGKKQVHIGGDEYEWIDDTYYIDSIVLGSKEKTLEYYKFFIRCIDLKGKLVELD